MILELFSGTVKYNMPLKFSFPCYLQFSTLSPEWLQIQESYWFLFVLGSPGWWSCVLLTRVVNTNTNCL